MNVAYINPQIITWALARQGVQPEQIATTVLPAEKIKAWIGGDGHPTETQAEVLAGKLKIPYLVLFLSNPPSPEEVPIPDLRTRSGKTVANPSHEFIQIINEGLLRQDWYRDYAQQNGRKKLSFVGKFNTTNTVNEVASDMRRVLRVNDEFRQACNSWEIFLRRIITQAESVGVLVMRSGVLGHATNQRLDSDEFQGFALSDPYAPLVFINDTDARAAQIFTFAHELAHIWIGETGISNARLAEKTFAEMGRIERFCNEVAAEFLVPEAKFKVAWHSDKTIKVNLGRLGKFFWVSSLVALRRAYDLQKITFEEFKQALEEEYERYRAIEAKRKKKEEDAKKRQSGDFWATFKLRNSVLFSDTVASSVRSSKTTYAEASNLLGVSISTFERFLKREKAA